MLTHKLLAAVGLATALLLGVSHDASANPWRGPVRRGPIVRGDVVHHAPVYWAPAYRQGDIAKRRG